MPSITREDADEDYADSSSRTTESSDYEAISDSDFSLKEAKKVLRTQSSTQARNQAGHSTVGNLRWVLRLHLWKLTEGSITSSGKESFEVADSKIESLKSVSLELVVGPKLYPESSYHEAELPGPIESEQDVLEELLVGLL